MGDEDRVEVGAFTIKAGYSVDVTCTAMAAWHQRVWVYLKHQASASSTEDEDHEFVGGGKDNGTQDAMSTKSDSSIKTWSFAKNATTDRYIYVAIQHSTDGKDDTWKNSSVVGPIKIDLDANTIIGIFTSEDGADKSYDDCIVRVVTKKA
ncbi:hypothetical protein SISNIDRAFT_467106 [Sistotremastrum niveocremeum HHB9708]|uniref:Uncharacterized protein n=1 Tax=Sistotremastrum niveocremeum HHB9708 TaxID=1314777 RepID=A0A164TCQ8_9AGAM|nr:hypothetical protein SISNIDRAFT_467106 [Sistotremastrum niveocremeum HHB9708]